MEYLIYWDIFFKIYYYTILSLAVIYSVQIYSDKNFTLRRNNHEWIPTLIVAIFCIILIGNFPIPWNSYGDREVYAQSFLYPIFSENGNDKLFEYYTFYINKLTTDPVVYFLITAFIYILNYYVFCFRVCKKHMLALFIMSISAFMFLGYGINTLRAGFALSFLLLAFSFKNNKYKFILFSIIAIGCHFSVALPAVAFIISSKWNNTRLYFSLWFVAIILSFLFGSSFEALFREYIPDERVNYLENIEESLIYKTGFRIDFIIYSLAPIICGYIYIYKRNFKDKFYATLYNTYIISNIFWILVIRANFSDRFGYLSWFLMPIIIIYPLLEGNIYKDQNKKVALALFINGLFTFIMYLKE